MLLDNLRSEEVTLFHGFEFRRSFMEELGIDNPGPDEDEDGTDHPEEHDYHIIMNEYINGRSYNLTTNNSERLKILDSRLKNRQDLKY